RRRGRDPRPESHRVRPWTNTQPCMRNISPPPRRSTVSHRERSTSTVPSAELNEAAHLEWSRRDRSRIHNFGSYLPPPCPSAFVGAMSRATMRWTLRSLAAGVLLIGCLLPAAATTVRSLSLAELAATADRIVLGRCAGIRYHGAVDDPWRSA